MNSLITEILAAILILLSLVKVTMLFVNPRAWVGLTKRIYTDTKLTSVVSLALAGIVLYLLIRSGIDIVQILAVCLFLSLLIMVGITPYAPRLFAWYETQEIDQLFKEQWLSVLVWVAILAWGAYTLIS
jgi:hypothetical protein